MTKLRSILLGLLILPASVLTVVDVVAAPLESPQSKIISVIPEPEPAHRLSAKFDVELQDLLSKRSVAVADCYRSSQQVDRSLSSAKKRRTADAEWLSLSRSVRTAYEGCEPMRAQLRDEIGFFDRVVEAGTADDVSSATTWRSEAWHMMSIHYSDYVSKYVRLNDLLP